MSPSPRSAVFMSIVITACHRQYSTNTRCSCGLQLEILLLHNHCNLVFWQTAPTFIEPAMQALQLLRSLICPQCSLCPCAAAVMGRAHSCAIPSSSMLFSLPPSGAPHRRAASTPEALPDFLTGMPADLGRPGDADGMTGQHPR